MKTDFVPFCLKKTRIIFYCNSIPQVAPLHVLPSLRQTGNEFSRKMLVFLFSDAEDAKGSLDCSPSSLYIDLLQ